MSLRNALLIAMGGALGSVGRYGVQQVVSKYMASSFPYGTLLVNVIGCFVIGCVFGWVQKSGSFSGGWYIFLTTGFCGGFTTFSAFALENFVFIQKAAMMEALVYSFATLVVCFLLVGLGWVVAQQAVFK